MALAEPDVVVELKHEVSRQAFIEIRDIAEKNRVVTVIEFVSPTNKLAGDGRKKYRQKQRECVSARINLVEIDLTRGGRRHLLAAAGQIPARYRKAFQVCITRGHRKGYAVYGASLRQRLPAIPIPLRPTDAEVALDLQAVVDESYAKGRYEDIHYREPTIPPLEGEDAAWADEMLKAAGRR